MSEAAPKNGEFADGKLWFSRKAAVVTLGVTSLALEDLGSVESVELPEEGDDFSKGDVVATVEGSNGRLEVIAPASGLVHEINGTVGEDPDRVTEDPLEEGWLIKLEIEDPSELAEWRA